MKEAQKFDRWRHSWTIKPEPRAETQTRGCPQGYCSPT